jgi:HD-GYP domain-containing protein (c-di-GMP phosphodiesterase class II)
MPEQGLAAHTPHLRPREGGAVRSGAHAAILAFWLAIHARDPYTGMHCRRVARLAVRIGRALGLPAAEQRTLLHAGWLHDVGKCAVPDGVLLKPGPLDPEERQAIELHVRDGCRLLGRFPLLWNLQPIVAAHHERWDGTGYPAALAGTSIPLGARVLALSDVYDAMTTDRPHRRGMPRDKALGIIRDEGGRQFDPEITAGFVELVARADGGGVQAT